MIVSVACTGRGHDQGDTVSNDRTYPNTLDATLIDASLSLLGPIHATAGIERLEPTGDKERTIVAVLGLSDRARASTATLVDAAWGEAPPRSVIGALRTYIYRLRTSGWAELIVTTDDGYALAIRPEAIDATALGSALGRARSSPDPHERLALLDPLIRGVSAAHVLCSVCDTPLMMVHRSMLRSCVASAQDLHARALLDTQGPLAIEPLRALVRTDPTRESRWQMLIEALDLAGARSEASSLARQARSFIGDYLGVPSETIHIGVSELATGHGSATAGALG